MTEQTRKARAVVIFPYGGFEADSNKERLFFKLLETAIQYAKTPIVLAVNHDTVDSLTQASGGGRSSQNATSAKLSHDWLDEQLQKRSWGDDLIDVDFCWSVDTCQMWLEGWGHALLKYPDDERIVQLPGDLSRLGSEAEFFEKSLPEFIVRDDCDLILGDFNFGGMHSAKDLIDQYGTFPLLANWFPEIAQAIHEKEILHPRSEFLNLSCEILREILSLRKFAYEQTINIVVQLYEVRQHWWWETRVGVHRLGSIEDETGFRKYRDCLDQIERTERMLKVIWRELRWHSGAEPDEKEITKYDELDSRSTSIREAGRIILKSMLFDSSKT